jgi:FixJ family two-component response regulator
VRRARPVISVVDDDELVREAAKGLMESLGYEAVVFASSEDFLRSPQSRQTACLIADVNMPGMSGLELFQRLSASGKPVPTILITAYSDSGVRERALSAGVVGYLSKPFEEGDLLACVRSALTSTRSGRR